MTPLEIIKSQYTPDLLNSEGEPWGMTMEPGLTPEQITAFEEKLGFPLSKEIRELLLFTNGFTGGPLAGINFTCSDDYFSVEDDNGFAPKAIGMAADGSGNHWAYVLNAESRDLGPIYYFSHDPPVFIYQSPDLAHFLEEFFKMCILPHESLIEDVMEDRLKNVWVENPDLKTVQNARASSDPEIVNFARTLPDHWKIIDLRNPAIGSGFSWGRCRDFKRHGDLLIFGMDFKQPGWLTRLLRKFTDKA